VCCFIFLFSIQATNPGLAGVRVRDNQPIQNLVSLCNPLVLVINVPQLRELPAQHVSDALARANAGQISRKHVRQTAQVALLAHADVVLQLRRQNSTQRLPVLRLLDVLPHRVQQPPVDSTAQPVDLVRRRVLVHHRARRINRHPAVRDDLAGRLRASRHVPPKHFWHFNFQNAINDVDCLLNGRRWCGRSAYRLRIAPTAPGGAPGGEQAA
jgi:hypothetical protein